MNRSAQVLFALLAIVLLLGLTLPAVAAEKDKNADTTEGKVKSINVDKNEFVLTDTNNKNWTMQLDTKAKVAINDKDSKFSELRENDQVKVTYQKQGTKFLATKIQVTRK